jgi:hypothetical protein
LAREKSGSITAGDRAPGHGPRLAPAIPTFAE